MNNSIVDDGIKDHFTGKKSYLVCFAQLLKPFQTPNGQVHNEVRRKKAS